jgi:hypothetical protein
VVLLLSRLQLIELGVIGEYIGSIHLETRRRSLYFVEGLHEQPHDV